MNEPRRYCGRDFQGDELEAISRLIERTPEANRSRLSRMVCQHLGWLKPDGGLKDMSCRVAMLRMQADGLITLPPPGNRNGNGKAYRRRTPQADPQLFTVDAPAGRLQDLRLDLVSGRADSHLWNEHVDRYHYLGYQPLPGAQLRYFARADGQILALFGFGAAAWKTAPRDLFIGWTHARREANLHLVVNNARFLILPWVRSKNLASRLLGMVARRIAADWYDRYGYRPVLLETFVELPRFAGTAYKAANWTYLGDTKGRGKLDVRNEARLPRKAIWVYPIARTFRRTLCA